MRRLRNLIPLLALSLAACGGSGSPTLAFAPPVSQLAAYTVLYGFANIGDGMNPHAGLVQGSDGNFYGTTLNGFTGLGTVFQLTPGGAEKVLHSFAGANSDGANPRAGLIQDSNNGNLYGTTSGGGANNLGTVFQIATAGAETLLYSFDGTHGAAPYAGLIQDSTGNLYGTTYSGGANNLGTVFKLTPPTSPATTWTETVLYSFSGNNDGANPRAGLIRDSAGNLYGTTSIGGASGLGYGTVFKLTPGGAETVLHSFGGGSDGVHPYAGVIQDSAGNLYGTTYGGGANTLGTVFRITPAGAETVLYSFSGGYFDGATPRAGLIQDSAGNLYGTTSAGGAFGFGTVFKLAPPPSTTVTYWTESVLYSFFSSPDGAYPYAGLIQDNAGNFYGTTSAGGPMGGGTVFEFTP